MADEAVTYGNYLAIDELLALQRPRSIGPEHDEMLFIVIHQVYELWFKQVLHELDHVLALLDSGEPFRAQHSLKRILTILKVLVAQLDILETMTPLEFQSFRARLEAASGFQSDQFRQLEFVLGQKSRQAIERFPAGSRAREALQRRFDQGTLWDAFLRYLSREGYAVPPAQLARDVTARVEASVELQATLIEVYRRDPMRAEMCERLVDLDEGIQEWRYRHVKMVQRTIGAKIGTGGSAAPQDLNHYTHDAGLSGLMGYPFGLVSRQITRSSNHQIRPPIHLPEGGSFNPLDSSHPMPNRHRVLAHFGTGHRRSSPARRLLYTG